ncbi:hypothetical protein ACRYI5_01225 [Furfurilactobacillus sp. WILCCON 0119]
MAVQTQTFEAPNWLASAHYQNFTEQATINLVSGQPFQKNGKTVGLVVNDVTLTDATEPQPVAVMYEGWVYAERLPVSLSDTDRLALIGSGIHFRGEEAGVPAATTPASN